MDFVIQNGNVMLSERQMQRFIDCNDLYLRFGITTAEVAKDVATMFAMFNFYATCVEVGYP